jgi:cardiolipin synthase (CMP-forming)
MPKNIFNIPNFLTALRIFLTPMVAYSIFLENWWTAFLMFIVAAGTDLLDGIAARALNSQTEFGKAFDPVADKIFIIGLFGALAFLKSPSFLIPEWFFALMLLREMILVAGASLMMLVTGKNIVSPSIWGKLTTFFQLTFISWIFICKFFGWLPVNTYNASLVLLIAFSSISLIQYMGTGIGHIRK